MTCQDDFTTSSALLEQLSANGLDALPDLFRVLLNAAMQAERQKHLGADLHERTERRTGYANGYKDKTLDLRVGRTTVQVPQVRDGSFYSQALEKGTRSERALKLALAEMYVQGVSTRRVAAITEKMCRHARVCQPDCLGAGGSLARVPAKPRRAGPSRRAPPGACPWRLGC